MDISPVREALERGERTETMTKEEAKGLKQCLDDVILNVEWDSCSWCYARALYRDDYYEVVYFEHRDGCPYLRALEIIDANTDSE